MSEASGAVGTAAAAPSGGEAAAASTSPGQPSSSSEVGADEGVESGAGKEIKSESADQKADEVAKPTKKQIREWAKETLEQDFEDDDKADDFVREFATNSHKLNKQLVQVFDENPEAGAVIYEMVKNGTPFLEALSAFLSPEEYAEAIDGSDKSKDALKLRKENLAKQKTLEAEIGKNKDESEKSLVAFMGKNNLDDKAVADLFDNTILPVYKSLIDQKFTNLTWENFLRLHNYKKDVGDAQALGEARANNAKSKIQKDKEPGDGLPQISGGGGAAKIAEKAVKKMGMVARVAQENEEMRNKQ